MRTLLIAPAVALALMACGGSSRLSSAEFKTKANAICEKATTDLAAADRQAIPSGTFPDGKTLASLYLKSVIPRVRVELRDLGKLKPPASTQSALDAVLAKTAKIADDLEKTAKSDPNGLLSKQTAFEAVKPDLQHLGLTTCAGG